MKGCLRLGNDVGGSSYLTKKKKIWCEITKFFFFLNFVFVRHKTARGVKIFHYKWSNDSRVIIRSVKTFYLLINACELFLRDNFITF